MTHLSFFSSALRSTESLQIVGEKFRNLVKLKINLSFNEIILSASSPITQLTQLKEFSIDLNTFTDSHVDDGLIWCIKDGLPSVNVLEISRACLSGRAFNSINYCLPHLKKLILKAIEVQCNCQSSDLRDRIERYSCVGCRNKCWHSVADLSYLKELQVVEQYHRSEKPKPFHEELSQLLPQFKCLRHLKVIRYDISSSNLIENLNKLIDITQQQTRQQMQLSKGLETSWQISQQQMKQQQQLEQAVDHLVRILEQQLENSQQHQQISQHHHHNSQQHQP